MGIERLEGLRPQDSYFNFVVDKVKERASKDPEQNPFFFLADEFGMEGADDLKRIDKILTDTFLKPGEAPRQSLYPGSELFRILSLRERKIFLGGYGAVTLEAVIKTMLEAKTTHSFDFKLFSAIFNERVRGTCVRRAGEYKAYPLNPKQLNDSFQKDPSAAYFLSEEGLNFNPALRVFIAKSEALSPMRGQTIPAYKTFAEALTMRPPVAFARGEWDSMWDAATKAEKEQREKPK